MRVTFAEINLSSLKYNYLNIKGKNTDSKVMAVVKADAYGHGMPEVAKALNKLGKNRPAYYGVALTEEGVKLRNAEFIKEPILAFSPLNINEVPEYLKYKIIPTICMENDLNKISKLNLNEKLKVQINVDTGMGRIGINYLNAVKLIKKIAGNDKIVLDGIYTHFATSDEKDKAFADVQLERFNKIIGELRQLKINTGIVHAANSGAIIDMPNAKFDMVRPGISLYGYYPSLETTESIKLEPVMSLISKISIIKIIEKGDSVSYGRRFIAKKRTKVATLPIGYADGIPRNLTNNLQVIINGRLFKQIGTVTMDRISIDVTGSGVRIGNRAVLIGKSGKNQITAWDWSKKLNTIPYEITCGISKRVPRVYKG
ncbi:alanine racemase [bacterium BMS3Abin04]|nr:alanine racemase [bacterium BMS3Abin04]